MRSHNTLIAIFLAIFVSKLGNSVFTIILPVLVFQETGQLDLAIYTTLFSNAPYLILPWLSPLLDRMEKVRVYRISEISLAFLMCLLPVFVFNYSFAAIAVILILTGVASSASRVTMDYGIMPSLAVEGKRHNIYVTFNALNNFASVLGPAVAGFLIYMGLGLAGIAFNAFSFAMTAVVSFLIVLSEPRTKRKAKSKNWLGEILEAFNYLIHDRILVGISATMFLVNVALGSYVAFFSAFYSDEPVSIGVVFSLASAFGILIPLLAHRLREENMIMLTGASTMLAFVFSMLFLVDGFVFSAVGWVLVYVCVCGMNIGTATLRSIHIPSEINGRVNAQIRSVIFFGIPISSILFAQISAWYGPTAVFAVIPFVLFIACITWTWCIAGKIRGKNVQNSNSGLS